MTHITDGLILGVVEGLTEFLPISSTAHLIITSRLFGIVQSEYLKTFEIAIQSGAILAIVVLYWRRFLDWEVLKRILAAFVPTGLLGLVLYKFVKAYLLGNMPVALWALGAGGALLILIDLVFKRGGKGVAFSDMKYGRLAGIGVFQTLALVPGVSRSASAIVGGLILGMERTAAAEFSFLLGAPTLLAATGLDLLKSAGDFSHDQFLSLGVGLIVSFLAAWASIKFLLNYLKKHSLVAFGVYRIVLALILLALGFAV